MIPSPVETLNAFVDGLVLLGFGGLALAFFVSVVRPYWWERDPYPGPFEAGSPERDGAGVSVFVIGLSLVLHAVRLAIVWAVGL